MDQTEFIKITLNILSPISEISTNANDKFGKILENKVFLLNYAYKFTEVKNSLITRLNQN